MAENPKVIVKKNKVQPIVDFCLDESIEFTVKKQAFPDNDFEVEFKIKEIKTALLAGMFLRENRLEIDGMNAQQYKKNSKKNNSNQSAKNDQAEEEPTTEVKEDIHEPVAFPDNDERNEKTGESGDAEEEKTTDQLWSDEDAEL
jgi:hypothetical protein